MPFFTNKTICLRPTLTNCLNKTGCFSTLRGHTVNFARPRLKFACLCQKFEICLILLQNLQIRHVRPKCQKNCVLRPNFFMCTTLYSIDCLHYTVYSIQYQLYTLYSIQSIVSTVYTVQCKVYSINCLHCTVYSLQY